MSWLHYWSILRRRWILILVILLADVAIAGVLFARSYRHVGYQACSTLYVADVSSPSLIAAPPTTLQALGQLLTGETAANFFADDLLDVAQSGRVASYVSGRLSALKLPNSSPGDIAVSGSRRDRTDQVCVSNPTSQTALAASSSLNTALTSARGQFIGTDMRRRTYVSVVSNPTVSKASSSHDLVNFALRVILGLLLAGGVALLWDALDPNVRTRHDVESALGVPVLASF